MIEVAFTDVSLDLGDAADEAFAPRRCAPAPRPPSASTPVLMRQVHGDATLGARRRTPGRCAPTATRWSPRRPGSAPAGARRRLRAGAAGRPGHRLRSRAVHSGRPGPGCRRRRPPPSRALREQGAEPTRRVDRPARVRRLLRGARPTCRTRSPPSCPRRASTTSWGTPALDLGAGVRAQLAAGGRRRRARGRRLHPRGRRLAVLPPRRRRRHPLRRRDLEPLVSRARRARGQPRRRTPPHRRRVRRGGPRRRTTVSLVVVTKFFPASDVRLLADLGVTDVGENRHQEARGEGRRVRRPRAALALHRRPAVQQGRSRRVVRRRRRVASTGAKLVGPLVARRAGPRARGRRAAPGQPRPARLRPPLRRGPGRPRRPRPTGWRRPQHAPAARPDGRRAAALAGRTDAGRGLRPARRDPRGLRARPPRATVLSAGMSGDLEAAIGHGATHVRVGSAVLGPRPAGPVMSTTVTWCPDPGAIV